MNINKIKNENGVINLNITLNESDFENHFITCESCGEITTKLLYALFAEGISDIQNPLQILKAKATVKTVRIITVTL